MARKGARMAQDKRRTTTGGVGATGLSGVKFTIPHTFSDERVRADEKLPHTFSDQRVRGESRADKNSPKKSKEYHPGYESDRPKLPQGERHPSDPGHDERLHTPKEPSEWHRLDGERFKAFGGRGELVMPQDVLELPIPKNNPSLPLIEAKSRVVASNSAIDSGRSKAGGVTSGLAVSDEPISPPSFVEVIKC